MIAFVDTSALIALLDEDDIRHVEAVRTFRWLVREADLVTHNYVQVEALAVAARRLGPAAADRLVDRLFPIARTIWVAEPLHRAALAALQASAAPVSLVDHVSFLVMRQLGVDVTFAFDADFEAHGFRRVVAPDERSWSRRANEVPAAYGTATQTPGSDLVSVAEISARAGRSVNTIQSWRRRHGAAFPAPVAHLAAGPVWDWRPVAEWIARRSAGRPLAG